MFPAPEQFVIFVQHGISTAQRAVELSRKIDRFLKDCDRAIAERKAAQASASIQVARERRTFGEPLRSTQWIRPRRVGRACGSAYRVML
jgi:hypothetical protein